jgi:hypothetical protein
MSWCWLHTGRTSRRLSTILTTSVVAAVAALIGIAIAGSRRGSDGIALVGIPIAGSRRGSGGIALVGIPITGSRSRSGGARGGAIWITSRRQRRLLLMRPDTGDWRWPWWRWRGDWCLPWWRLPRRVRTRIIGWPRRDRLQWSLLYRRRRRRSRFQIATLLFPFVFCVTKGSHVETNECECEGLRGEREQQVHQEDLDCTVAWPYKRCARNNKIKITLHYAPQ